MKMRIIGKRKVEREGGAVTGGVVSDIWKGRGHGHVILPRFTDSLVPVVPLPAPPPPPSLTLFTFLNHPFQLISIIVFSGINLNPSTTTLSKQCSIKSPYIHTWDSWDPAMIKQPLYKPLPITLNINSNFPCS